MSEARNGARMIADHLMEITLSPKAMVAEDYYARSCAVELKAKLELNGEPDPEVPRQETRPQPRPDMHPGLATILGLNPNSRLSVEQVSQILAGRRADGLKLETGGGESAWKVSYFDFCFSAPKSASLAWALAPTKVERVTILQAHRDAVDASLRYVTHDIGMARRGARWKGWREPGHTAWINFDHFTRLPTADVVQTDSITSELVTDLYALRSAQDIFEVGDPHLHTHCVVLNLVLTDCGHVGALDAKAAHGHIREYGAFYQAQLAAGLRQVGVAVELDKHTRTARLPAISETVCQAFSEHTLDGTKAANEKAARRGLNTPDMPVNLLEGNTRVPCKNIIAGSCSFATWRSQAEGLGWDSKNVVSTGDIASETTRGARLEAGREVASLYVEKEFSHRSVLSGADLRAAAAQSLIGVGMTPGANGGRADVDAIIKLMRERGIHKGGQFTKLVWGDEDEREDVRVTAALNAAEEYEANMLIRNAAADLTRALSHATLDVAVEHSGLSFDDEHGWAQRAAIERLGMGGALAAAVSVVGSDKTMLLRPLVNAWKARGDSVIGVAVAWSQAELLKEVGIGSVAALTALLYGPRANRELLSSRTVMVIEELGQMGARQMLDLLRLRQKHGFRVVLMGEYKRCQRIEAGPVINLLRRALGNEAIPKILITRRQRSERERQIAGLFREGKATEALAMKCADGTAEAVLGNYDDVVRRVAELWRQRREANAGDADFSISVAAPTNAHARAVALALREERRALGELEADIICIQAIDQDDITYNLTLAPGDRVRLFDRVNARFLDGGRGAIGNNGSVLEVRSVATDGIVLRTAAGRDGLVTWENLADKKTGRTQLAPGDVLVSDASQGITSSEHINSMPGGSADVLDFRTYASQSRPKDAWLITSDFAERHEVMNRRAFGDPRPLSVSDVWENVAWNLARRPAKTNALEFLNKAHIVCRGATHAMQAGIRMIAARKATDEPWMPLGTRMYECCQDQIGIQAATQLRRLLDIRWETVNNLTERLRQTGLIILQDNSRKGHRSVEGQAKAVRDHARDNQARSAEAAKWHCSPELEKTSQMRLVTTVGYWRHAAAKSERSPRPNAWWAVQHRREAGIVAAVVDRLALAVGERGVVLASIRQGRAYKAGQVTKDSRQIQDKLRALEKPAVLSQAAPMFLQRTVDAVPRLWEPVHFARGSVAADFAVALRQTGLRVTGLVELDGRMRRVPVEGDRKGQKSGTYVGYLDGWPAGHICNHKSGIEILWKADRPMLQMAPAERAAFAAVTAVRFDEWTRKQQDIQARAARMAYRLWAAAAPVTSHPYLAAKGVRAHGLRQDRRGRLLVPVHGADGRLWGVQRVDGDGSKLFLKGAKIEGGHALIGGWPKPETPLLVAEDYATGATLHEATGLSVAVAFNAGNLAAVAKAYRAVDLSRPIIIAGDTDRHLPLRPVLLPNVGKERAEAAAAAVGGIAALPSFPVGDWGRNWNDLALRHGNASVATAIWSALACC